MVSNPPMAVFVALAIVWWIVVAPYQAEADPELPYPLLERLSLDDVLFLQLREALGGVDQSQAPLSIIAYRVNDGDTIDGIAGAFGLPTTTIVSLNRLESGMLESDAILLVPNRAGIFVPETPRSPRERELQRYANLPGESVRVIVPADGVTAFHVVPVTALTDSTPDPERESASPSEPERASGVAAPPFVAPLASIAVSSPFGPRRHPFTGEWRAHNGVDLRAPHGAAVFAALTGKVVAIDRDQLLGLSIIIEHRDGYTTRYAHLREALVRVGDPVQTGDTIARSGSTGYSTGPHLHFEILLDGTPLNPLDFLVAESDL